MSQTKKQKALDDRLRGKTFGLTFVDKVSVSDDDLMLILDAHLQQERLPFVAGGPVHGPAFMASAAIAVSTGKDFKANTACLTDSGLAIKLTQL